ncbi:unnamed protein product [Onchocerca flexuosa]|uniref:Ovule protein n=1 Tax=Onchocerca flexuosa TaxID=387005 RepID=A0A183H8C7_9BILA|nr:unnamed protein product [Onchocerca flexuosa]
MIWGFISLKNRCGDKVNKIFYEKSSPGSANIGQNCHHYSHQQQRKANRVNKKIKRINWSPECIYGMRRSIIINVFLIVGAFR